MYWITNTNQKWYQQQMIYSLQCTNNQAVKYSYRDEMILTLNNFTLHNIKMLQLKTLYQNHGILEMKIFNINNSCLKTQQTNTTIIKESSAQQQPNIGLYLFKILNYKFRQSFKISHEHC
ncbi:unnamed protein product [Paramecium octaurelia]|uniref:Uncharacterized protein n=1 Tax=Paramecium octaurelia TaxID=43137 RepID=A0A8S1VIB6_PAROT|nr:unnamed protein product [Paramecium octaurelia]